MTDWGPEIDANNDGVKFDWLDGDEEVMCFWADGTNVWCGPYLSEIVYGWDEGFKIKLPEDHEYYANIVKVKKMTVEEAQHCGYCIDTLDDLGILFQEPSVIDSYEAAVGGLGLSERNAVKAFIDWQKQNA